MVRRVIVLLLLGIVLGLQQYEADFLMFDQDGDQVLKYDELRAQFPSQNPYNTADFVAQFFLDYDSNGGIAEFKINLVLAVFQKISKPDKICFLILEAPCQQRLYVIIKNYFLYFIQQQIDGKSQWINKIYKFYRLIKYINFIDQKSNYIRIIIPFLLTHLSFFSFINN